MPITKFFAVTEIFTYDFQGYQQVKTVLAPEGEEFTCETKQMPDNLVSDNSVRFHFASGVREESFEILGRLVGCGAVKQIDLDEVYKEPKETDSMNFDQWCDWYGIGSDEPY